MNEAKRGGAEVAEEDAEKKNWSRLVSIFDILRAPLSAFSATLRFDSSSLSDDRQHLGDLRAVVFMRASAVLNLIIGNTDDGEIAVHVIGLR